MKIAGSLEDVSGRLNKIERAIPGVGGDWNTQGGRRRSSFRRNYQRHGSSHTYAPSLPPVVREENLDADGGDLDASIIGYVAVTNVNINSVV